MDIIGTVQAQINDVGIFWPTQNLLDAINEAQLYIYTHTKWQRAFAPLTLNSGDDIIPIPVTIITPQWVEDTSYRYFPTTQRELENFMRTWRTAQQAKPKHFVLWDATHLRVFPSPDQPYNYTLWGMGLPTEVVAATTDLPGPPLYTQALSHWATALLLQATRPDVAEFHMSHATDLVTAFKKQLRNYQGHNIRRLVPGKRFDLQQSGQIQELPVYFPIEGLEST